MIKIVFSTDIAGFANIATVVASVLRRTASPVWVRIYTRGFSYTGFEVSNLKAEFIRCDEEVTGTYPGHVSRAVFDRLRIIRDFNDWDKALILDHDMLVFADLADYFSEPFDDNLLMGRLFGPGNTLSLQLTGRNPLPSAWEHCGAFPYFYMGPMMNLEAMRREGFWEVLTEAHSAIGCDEQMSLTAASGGRIKGVDKKWNLVPAWDKLEELAQLSKGSDGACDDTSGLRWTNGVPEGIIHWNGPAKPWHYRSKVWRADLWESESCGWETLRSGRWDKPVSVEVEPWNMDRIQSLLRRGWRVRVWCGVGGDGSETSPEGIFPDFEQVSPLAGEIDVTSVDMVRIGPFAELNRSFSSFSSCPDRIVVEGPRSSNDVSKLRILGYLSESRVIRRDWPTGGPHPKVLSYFDMEGPTAVAEGEDLYLSRIPTDRGVAALAPNLGAESISTWEISSDLEEYIRKKLPALVPSASAILEFGPGLSTRTLARSFPSAQIASIEHDREYYRRSKFDLLDFPNVTIYHAPLDPALPWYDMSRVPVAEYDLILVDGPPGPSGFRARRPAISMIDAVKPGGVVILDDILRADEREDGKDWLEAGFAVVYRGASFTVLQQTTCTIPPTWVPKWRTPVDLAALAQRIYVISLPDRTDRLNGLRRNWQASAMPMDFEVVNGVRPDPSGILWSEMKGMEGYGQPESLRGDYVVGAVGCKRAGIDALQTFLDSGAESALICQDDCRWRPEARESIGFALAQLPEDWDLVYFSASARSPHLPFSPRLARLTGARFCTAILWRRKAASRAITSLIACDCEMDLMMQKLHGEMNAFCVVPMPAYQARSHSDIVGKVVMPPNR